MTPPASFPGRGAGLPRAAPPCDRWAPMRARLAVASLAVVLPLVARAQPVLGVRVGWGAAVGSAAADVPVGESTSAQVPVQLDAGWRLGSATVGGYVAYGFGVGPPCDGGARCEATVLRLGAAGALSRPLAPRVEAWGGAALGWESSTHRRVRPGGEVETSYGGPEASLQAGVDFRIARRLALGPWVQLAVGRYQTLRVASATDSATAGVDDGASHAWFLAGVRAAFELSGGGP